MKVTTLLCWDGPEGLHAPDHEDLYTVNELCRHPDTVARLGADADRLVLALHHDDYELAPIQTGARAVGIDPLGVEILEMPRDEDDEWLQVTLAGAEARAGAFGGSQPEHARPSFPKRLSRRSLLTTPKPEYEAVPMVDHGVCAADDGCHACADVCPQDAYSWSQGRIRFDKDVCLPCGRCLTTCPRGAIDNPAVTPQAIEAQITALVEASARPLGIAFVCKRRTDRVSSQDWYQVEVPCTAMVPGTWVLAALLHGAAAATSLPCSATGCSLEQDAATLDAVGFARSTLEGLQLDRRQIPEAPTEISWQPLEPVEITDAFGLIGPPKVVAALAEGSGTTLLVSHPGSPIGDIAIDAASCTLCTMCSQTCPTGALEGTSHDDRVVLSFDPNLCTACAQCVPTCPERVRGAIKLTPMVDVDALAVGRRTVNEGKTLACESCGGAIAPSPMMDRIGALLGEEHAATTAILTRRCMDCRGMG